LFCKHCGKEIESEYKYCKYCGEELIDAPLENKSTEKENTQNRENNIKKLFQLESEYKKREKSTIVAFLLWFFFGGLAVHRFYSRRYASGTILLIINLAFTITAIVKGSYYWLLTIIPALWIFIDLFLIRGMVREENYKIRRFVERIIK